jgi:aromatic ring-cleaving dioxygenase
MSVHPNVGSVVNPDIIQNHAHVYYDPASSRDRAARLRERVAMACLTPAFRPSVRRDAPPSLQISP